MELYLNKPVKNLSYGYKQKSLIARSIITNPDVLIIDEPFLGLDYSSYLKFLDILKDYKRITFIISTQNPKIKDEFSNFGNYEQKEFFLNQYLKIYSFLSLS